MTAANIAHGHLTCIVSTAGRTFTVNERLLWYGCSNLLERTNNLVSLTRCYRFEFTYCHFLFSNIAVKINCIALFKSNDRLLICVLLSSYKSGLSIAA